MLRAIGSNDDGPVIFMGLDDENLKRLTSDQPIRVELDDFVPDQPPGLPHVQVVVFHVTPESIAWLAQHVERVAR